METQDVGEECRSRIFLSEWVPIDGFTPPGDVLSYFPDGDKAHQVLHLKLPGHVVILQFPI